MAFPFPTDILEFIAFIGGPAFVGVLEAYLLEQLPLWRALTAQQKRLVVFLLSSALPFLSDWLIGTLAGADLSVAQTWLNFGLQALAVWFGSQTAHFRKWDRPA